MKKYPQANHLLDKNSTPHTFSVHSLLSLKDAVH